MSLPRFLDRVIDAAVPVLGGLDRDAVRDRLGGASVTLRAGDVAAAGPGRAGFLLAANLAARLYPRIRLAGPDELVRKAEGEIILVNPQADVSAADEPTAATLVYECPADGGDAAVAVFARGWNVYVDDAGDADEPGTVPAALAAAALGIGELFRIVFAAELEARGRHERQPGGFNLVTLGEPAPGLSLPDQLDVGRFNLVGAGAIGQAAARTLAEAGIVGTMVAVDPEKVALSNLQRYVLTRDTDVGAVKADLLIQRLAKSGIEVVPVASEWSALLVDGERPTLVALDSPEARIGLQAGLPGPIYNAWTQPADVGWSRHERFGDEPCLACLYWPDHERPSRHEQIAAAFRQHPLRVLAYLVQHRPVSLPLPPGGVPVLPGVEVPPEADQWTQRAILEDIADAAGTAVSELANWRERELADLYQEGICGGALLYLDVGEAPRELLVPLAHQSAFAGVMLATEFIVAQVPELRATRAEAIEGRFDILAGLPQVLARPRARTVGCLCGDAVFLDVYRGKFAERPEGAKPAAIETGEDEVA